MHLNAPAHQRRTQAAAHGRVSVVWSVHRSYDADWERGKAFLGSYFCTRNSDQEKPMESSRQHGQMAVCASSLCPLNTSPVIDNTRERAARRRKNLLKEGGIRKRWKQSRTSVVAIASENLFSASTPSSDSTSTPSGKTTSTRPNPPDDNSRTPRGGK